MIDQRGDESDEQCETAVACDYGDCAAEIVVLGFYETAAAVLRARASGWVMIYGDFGWGDYCPAHGAKGAS